MLISSAYAATPAPGAEPVFPPFDPTWFPSQLLWLAITFGLLYWLMSRVALPRVADILKTREDRVTGDLKSAADMQKQADDAAVAYEKALSDAKGNAQSTVQQMRDKLNTQLEGDRKALEANLNGKLAAAEAQIAATKAQAMSSVAGIATDTAGEIIKHITGKSVDASAIARAVAAEKIG